MTNSLKNRLNVIHQKIIEAKRANQNVKLICVSKTFSIAKIREAIEAGIIDFGENYVQEWEEKFLALPHVRWHFIGRVQTNKLKKIAGNCDYIHSIDREDLFDKLASICEQNKRKQKVLIQVSLADEESKAGFTEKELERCLPKFLKQELVQVCGLMTMPPLQNSAEENRKYFRRLRELKAKFKNPSHDVHSFAELSMGTSHDFNVAIEEGSTMVRLGTSLMGERS